MYVLFVQKIEIKFPWPSGLRRRAYTLLNE